MKIYNVLINDRHTDPEIHSFTDRATAIKFAEDTVLEYCQYPEDLELMTAEQLQPDNWVYYARYSCEGDYVRVTEDELK